jgi:transcription elongation factor GreA
MSLLSGREFVASGGHIFARLQVCTSPGPDRLTPLEEHMMPVALTPASRTEVLTARLATLRAERHDILAEIAPVGVGDDADRATNVDGHVRLAMLDQRIAAVEVELAETELGSGRTDAEDGTVSIGKVVTVDLGDGPETYLLGTVDEAGEGVDVITPSSPLGKVLQGARAGTTVSYAARPGSTLQARLLSVA